MAFKDLTSSEYKMFCDPLVDIPVTVNRSAVAVQRGNCTFSEKAQIAQHHGIEAVIIVSQTLVYRYSCVVLKSSLLFLVMVATVTVQHYVMKSAAEWLLRL